MRTYAIGDIHGQLAWLRRVHDWIEADRARIGDPVSPVIHLGDLTDRGPESRGVVDFLMEGMAEGRPWRIVRGNHDRLFCRFLDDPEFHDPAIRSGLHWLDPRLGGAATLASYGIARANERPLHEVHAEAVAAVPAAHKAFLESLPLMIFRGDVLFVHAGVRPGVAMEAQDEEDLIWIRDGFLEHEDPFGPLIVHGHTALHAPRHLGNRVNLDSGAGYGRPLTAAVFEAQEVFVLGPKDRRPLPMTPEHRLEGRPAAPARG